MTTSPSGSGPSAPFRIDPAAIARIGEVLAAADFSEAGVFRRLQSEETVELSPREFPRLLQMTRGKTPLDILIRWFLLGAAATVAEAETAVAPTPLDTWLDLGLLVAEGPAVSAPLRLVPANRLLIAFDPSTLHSGTEARADHVYGPGMSSINLLNGTIRKPVDSVLDLGTGSGIQAMMCAPHARRVVATDVNPRALNIAGFNAILNGLDQIEFREGSRFGPAGKERFDLVLMNPPFAISPGRRFLFRDGGMEGDGFVKALLTEVPDHLTEGGFCQITAQWAHLEGRDWQSRLKGWLDGRGCDAWVLRMKTQSPETYAANWISETENLPPEEYRRQWSDWMAYFDARNITAVSTGMIVLRRRQAALNHFWVSEDAESVGEHAGEAFYTGFLLRDFLAEASDDGLLSLAFRLSPDARIAQTLAPATSGWHAEKIVLRHARGIHFAGNLDGLMIGLLGRCDGRAPLGVLLDDLAMAMQTPRDDIQASVLAIFRNLVERGFVLPPSIASESTLNAS